MTSESAWLQSTILAFLTCELAGGTVVVLRTPAIPPLVTLISTDDAPGRRPLVAKPAFGDPVVVYVAIGSHARAALVRLQQLALVTVIP